MIDQINDLPPEIITEIFTYLPWYDRLEACLVCKLWWKIGQQMNFASKDWLSFTHCNLNDDTQPGSVLINSDRNFYNIRFGKAVYLTRNCNELFRKIGRTLQQMDLTNMTNECENGLLLKILEKCYMLKSLKVGTCLADQINSKPFLNYVAQQKQIKQLTLHGVNEICTQHLLDLIRDQDSHHFNGVQITLYFNCSWDNRDKFDSFFDQLALVKPHLKLLKMTVPFKLKALPMLTAVNFNFDDLQKLEITSPKSFQDLKLVCSIMPNLKELILWLGCLDFQLFDVFDNLINLETLRIQSGLRLTEESAFCQSLKPKPNLKVLEIELIEGQINVQGFERMIKAMSNLRTLVLSQSEVGDQHFFIICDNLLKLQTLQIDFGKITDTGMSSANWKNLGRIQTLKISGCHRVSDAGFLHFPQFHHMKELRLNYISLITAIGIKMIVKACPFIEYLSLDGCTDIDDDAIELITVHLSRLRQLDIYHCIKVTHNIVPYLIQNCKRLQLLDLSAVNIEETDKKLLYEKIRSLRYIYDFDDGTDMSKYFKGRSLRRRELYLTALF